MNLSNTFLSFLFYVFLMSLTCCSKEEALSDYLNYETIVELDLPFNGSWYVVWGGLNLSENYHTNLSDQRFAIDVVQLENGSEHLGNGTKNDDYYCYGETLYAPGTGQVVKMKNSV